MPKRFNPLVVPKHLQKDLPFKSKPKLQTKRKKPTLETRRAVVMEPDEKRVSVVNTKLIISHVRISRVVLHMKMPFHK